MQACSHNHAMAKHSLFRSAHTTCCTTVYLQNKLIYTDCQHNRALTAATHLARVCRVALTISGPPLAPAAATSRPLLRSTANMGDMALRGRREGAMKFASAAWGVTELLLLGCAKSSISSLSKMPVLLEMMPDPKGMFTCSSIAAAAHGMTEQNT